MKDPTYGRIDPDIQAMVEESLGPDVGVGPRTALENTLQARRDAGRHEDGPLRPPYAVDDLDTGDSVTPPEWWLEAAAERRQADRVGRVTPADVRALLAGTVGGFVGLALAFGIGWALPIRPETVPSAILGAVGVLVGWAVGYAWGWRR